MLTIITNFQKGILNLWSDARKRAGVCEFKIR